MPDTSTAAEHELPASVESAPPQVSDSNAASSPAPGSSAESPTAKDSGSMLGAIKAALDGPEGKSSDPGPGETPAEAQTTPTAAEGTPEDLDPVPTDDEMKRYAPKTRERIEKLVGALKEKGREVAAFSDKAQAFDQIMGSLKSTGLEPAEVDVVFDIASLMKRDPQQALQRLRPIYEELSRRSGEVIPDDLAEEVRLGYVTEQRARELARARAGEQIRTDQLKQRDAQAEAERTRQQQEQSARDASTAAERWEAQKRQADPDFHLKQGRVAELTELEVLRRMKAGQGVKGPQEVLEICEAAYKRASDEIKRFQPAPKEVAPVSGTASPRAQAAPQSMLEAMWGVVGGR
jgi:hypothetical protein